MKLASSFLLWALSWQGVTCFNKKETSSNLRHLEHRVDESSYGEQQRNVVQQAGPSDRDLAVALPPGADYLIYFRPPYTSYRYVTDAITTLGSTYSIANANQFNAMTKKHFKKYKAIVFVEVLCFGLALISGSRATWSAAAAGNVMLMGVDAAGRGKGAQKLFANGLKFVAASNKTGLYFSSRCSYYTNYTNTTGTTSISILDKLGNFTAGYVSGCFNDAHIVASHPVTESLTDSEISNWNCSVSHVFSEYPSSFIPLAIARNVGTTRFADGTLGTPYLLIRGGSKVYYGNGIVEPPEECDDGNLINGDGCTQYCKLDRCGDGLPGLGEQCDDGNTVDGDGCSATCQNEPVCPPTDLCCGNPDGMKCNMGDGNKCLKNSKCMANKCEPGPLKICHAPTQCKEVVGGCNPATGFCTFVLKPNGTPCDDGKATTKIDMCKDGFCVGQ